MRNPDWRGFNLLDLFSTSVRWREEFPMSDGVVDESDFATIAEWGFTFARLPMSYRWFATGDNAAHIDDTRLSLIDRAVEFALKYEIHLSLNLHRAPGYCITSTSHFDFPEPGVLFGDADNTARFVGFWERLARRYADVPVSALSFNLLNEPPSSPADAFDDFFLHAVERIRSIDPYRTIVLEGPEMGLRAPSDRWQAVENIVWSMHLYQPFQLTHFDCPWYLGGSELPTWPAETDLHSAQGQGYREAEDEPVARWDRDALARLVDRWVDFVGPEGRLHVGEFGAYSRTPHAVHLAWMSDLLDVLEERDIGWALWNLRGPFGPLESRRDDVKYIGYRGLSLDDELLTILQRRKGTHPQTTHEEDR